MKISHKTPALVVHARVVAGLIMRDFANRTGYTSVGLAGRVLRPVFQLYFSFGIYLLLRGRLPLVGNDPYVFWAVTLLPYIVVIYPSFKVMAAISSNAALLSFPIVTPFDLILARSIVQLLCSFWVVALFFSSLFLFGVKIMPVRIEDALMATLAGIYLSFGLGWFSAVMNKMLNFWSIIKVILQTFMYFTSGVFFLPESMPQKVQNVIVYNPLLHVVAWLRAAYYEGFGYGLLDRTYLVCFATALLFLGMFLERASRGWLMRR